MQEIARKYRVEDSPQSTAQFSHVVNELFPPIHVRLEELLGNISFQSTELGELLFTYMKTYREITKTALPPLLRKPEVMVQVLKVVTSVITMEFPQEFVV